VLVAVNNTPVVVLAGCALAGHAHTTSSWSCDSLQVSLDIYIYIYGNQKQPGYKKGQGQSEAAV